MAFPCISDTINHWLWKYLSAARETQIWGFQLDQGFLGKCQLRGKPALRKGHFMLSNWCKISSWGCSDWDEFSRIAPWLWRCCKNSLVNLSSCALRSALHSWTWLWLSLLTRTGHVSAVSGSSHDSRQGGVENCIHAAGLTFSHGLTHRAKEGKIGLPLSL